jgi:hypothetical protein
MRFPSAAAAASSDPPIIRLPAVDDVSVAEVLTQLATIRDALPQFGVTISSRFADPVPEPPPYCEMFTMAVLLVETVLEKPPEDVPPECHAELAILLAMPGIPEQCIVQIAFGRETGERHVQKIAHLLSDARQAGMSVDDYVAERSRSGDIPRDALVRRFRGEWRGSPSSERTRAGVALLRQTAARVPEHLRPPLLCAVAWLQWAQGRRAVAMSCLAEALRIEPENVLAAGLQAHISSTTPEWLEATTVRPR